MSDDRDIEDLSNIEPNKDDRRLPAWNYQQRYNWLLENSPSEAKRYWDKWARPFDAMIRGQAENEKRVKDQRIEELLNIALIRRKLKGE
jgi:hypothetical protein